MFSQLYEQLKGEDIFKPQSIEKIIQDILSQPGVTKNEDDSYNTESNVDLRDLDLTKIPVKFRLVDGNFSCSFNKLVSLEGASEKVGGSFYCSYNKLVSLEGAPKIVDGDFWCIYNNLTSLEGIGEVKGEIVCTNNPVSEKELLATIGK